MIASEERQPGAAAQREHAYGSRFALSLRGDAMSSLIRLQNVSKIYGEPGSARRSSRLRWRFTHRRPFGVRCDRWSLRLRQVDPSAHHRRSHAADIRRGVAQWKARHGAAGRCRLSFPAILEVPVRMAHGAGQRHVSARSRAALRTFEIARAAAWATSSRSGLPASRTNTRGRSPAACSSVSRSRGLLRPIRASCCSTSPSAPSMR